MKKSKFILLSLILIVLLGFSLFFVPVGVKAATDSELDELSIEEMWIGFGLPLSAIDFVEEDGKGIMFFVRAIMELNESGIIYYIASLVPVQDYYFDDGYLDSEDIYVLPYNIFFSDSLLNMLSYYSDTYGVIVEEDGEGIMSALIPDWDRMVIIWDVDQQRFVGPNYLDYWMETSYNEGYDEGQNVGYAEGYDVGYGEGYREGIIENHEVAYYEGYGVGYDDGYNVGYKIGHDDARPELDILLITLILYILSIFVYVKFRLKWVLIATTLLWFVPIFLVENLFIKIFSVIMIIVTITLTFFGEREEEF